MAYTTGQVKKQVCMENVCEHILSNQKKKTDSFLNTFLFLKIVGIDVAASMF